MRLREVCGLEFCLFLFFLRSTDSGSTVSAGSAKHNNIIIGSSKVLNFRVHVFERAEMFNIF